MTFGNNVIGQPWGLAVNGRAEIQGEPDHAILRLAVNRSAPQPARALEAARSAAAQLRATVQGFGVEPADITSSRIDVHTDWEGHGTGRRRIGHRCRVEFTIRLRDLDLLDGALADAVEAGADEILGVGYDTTDRVRLQTQARRAAVADARAKAEVYAEAAGVTLGPVVHLEDLDLEPARPEMHRGLTLGASADGGAIAPGSLTVVAAVTVGFTIDH